MATDLAVSTQNGTADLAVPLDEAVEQALIGGDLKALTPAQRVALYKRVCGSMGLNELTQPFEYLHLNGKLVLYAKRNCTDQIRKAHNVSVQVTARDRHDDVYVVTARATMPGGRSDESIGAVPIAQLKGEALANALMKCETKAKRRVTLSIVGLSFLDESEVESIPGARPLSVAEAHESEPTQRASSPAWADEEDEEQDERGAIDVAKDLIAAYDAATTLDEINEAGRSAKEITANWSKGEKAPVYAAFNRAMARLTDAAKP